MTLMGRPLVAPKLELTMEDINHLETRYGSSTIKFALGEGGLIKALLYAPGGATAEVYLHGAQVTSWRGPTGREFLFCSSRATYAPGTAIRGGIPIVFPQFGRGELPSHGFARLLPWHLVEAHSRGGKPTLLLRLESSIESKRWWPFEFRCELELSLSETLELSFTCTNRDSKPFTFQMAFHTYFSVAALDGVEIDGLGQTSFIDNLENATRKREERSTITVREPVDRIYENTANSLLMRDCGSLTTVIIDKWNLPDSVLWNPGEARAKELSDLAPGDFQRFVCLECGAIRSPVPLSPHAQHSCGMVIRPII